MATCKDCLHYEVCDKHCELQHQEGCSTCMFHACEPCDCFKDRTKWAEQKLGLWVERRHEGMGGGWYTLFHCPECDTPSAKPRNFCSFCGLKMTEGSEGNA